MRGDYALRPRYGGIILIGSENGCFYREFFMRIIMMLLALSLLTGIASACSQSKREEMKSPCVGVEGSPCGPHRPVNSWWLT